MMRYVRLAALGLALVASLAHAGYSVDQLMADLAQNKGGRARFEEKQFVGLLDKPLVASGEMIYTPPDRLEKRTLLPKLESMVLDKDTLTMERDKRRMSINVSSRPEAQAFVASIRSTLSGNRQALEAHYKMELQGERAGWTLTLLPTEPEIAALLQKVTVSGSRKQVQRIEYLQADGDRSELTIEVSEP
jgi:outer membrane lipoprotein-sorting protein